MKRPMLSNEQVEILSDDSSSSDADNDVLMSQQLNDEPSIELSSQAWLFRRAKSYQEYMKLIPIPTKRGTLIPYTSWTGLGSSIKKIYEQPLHYLTNIHLNRLDQERLGAEDEDVPLDMIIHPAKAETTIWLIEEVHRRTSSPHHLAQVWTADPRYHSFIDAIFPKLGS
ncbi:protein RDM1 [Sesamum alatum]|uniref:Protein RDM1 n=1 Tax=Sesamum alatum TaxID=300844 RepID=A0AAE1Y4T7_9LAMI|nr:protein RDM1 [Sesamum alatum]